MGTCTSWVPQMQHGIERSLQKPAGWLLKPVAAPCHLQRDKKLNGGGGGGRSTFQDINMLLAHLCLAHNAVRLGLAVTGTDTICRPKSSCGVAATWHLIMLLSCTGREKGAVCIGSPALNFAGSEGLSQGHSAAQAGHQLSTTTEPLLSCWIR